MKQLVAAISVAALAFMDSLPGFAQTKADFDELKQEIGTLKEIQALRRDVEGLKAGQQGLQKDLQEIKTLLQARPTGGGAGGAVPAAPQNVVLESDGAPTKGENTAKLAMIEFTDYQ